MDKVIEFALNDPRSLWVVLGIAAGMVLLLLAVNRVPLTYTLRNITLRWLTTLLTAVAFTLVIGLLVVMLAFTTGMQRMTEGTGQPGNVLVLSEGANDEIFSNLDVGDLGEIEKLPEVRRDTSASAAGQSRDLPDRQPADSRSQARPAHAPFPAGSRHRRRGAGGRRSMPSPAARRKLVLRCRRARGLPRAARQRAVR